MLNKIDEEILQNSINDKSDIDVVKLIVKYISSGKLDEADYISNRLFLRDRLPDLSDVSNSEMKKLANKLSGITCDKAINISSKTRTLLKGYESYLGLKSEDRLIAKTKLDKNVTESINYRIGEIFNDADIDNELKEKILYDTIFEQKGTMLINHLFEIDNDEIKLELIRKLNVINKDLIDSETSKKIMQSGYYNHEDVRWFIKRVAMSIENAKMYDKLPYNVKGKESYHLIPLARALTKNMSNVEERRKVIEYISKSKNIMYSLKNIKWDSDKEKIAVIKDLPLNNEDYNLLLDKSLVASFATGIMLSLKEYDSFRDLPERSNLFYKSGKLFSKGVRYYKDLEDGYINDVLIDSRRDNKSIIDFKLPKNMKIGIEIECLGPCSYLLNKVGNLFGKWQSKEESSIGSFDENGKESDRIIYKIKPDIKRQKEILDESYEQDEKKLNNVGSEVASPILKGTREESKKLRNILRTLKVMGQSVNEKCAGHIHINADYFTTSQSLVNLYEIVGNCEKELFIMSNESCELPRIAGPSNYSRMFSGYIADDIKKGGKKVPASVKKRKEVLQRLAKVHGNSRYVSLNLLNAAEEYNVKNTVEFRMPNGTLDYKTWMENIRLFTSIAEKAEMLGRIEQKINDGKLTLDDLTEKQIKMLRLEEEIKNPDIDKTEKVSKLLELAFDDDEQAKKIFMKRYKVNSAMLNEVSKEKNPFEYNAEFKRNYKEIEKPHSFDLKNHLFNLFKKRSDVIDLISEEQDMINIAAEKEINKQIIKEEEKEKEEIKLNSKNTIKYNDETISEEEIKLGKLHQRNKEDKNKSKQIKYTRWNKEDNKHIDLYKDNDYKSRLESDRDNR